MISSFINNIKNNNFVDEYMSCIMSKCENKMPTNKKSEKVQNENIIIPTTKNYELITTNNYNLSQLKIIAKNYKLKISGNKNQLISRIYSHLYLSSFIIKIQKRFRGVLVQKYINLRGPAILNRKLCNNSNDFVTLEPLNEIEFDQFISYKDVDGFIYGFNICSLYNTFFKIKTNNSQQNPYNRNNIPEDLFKSIKTIIRLSKILKIEININFDDDIKKVTTEKAIELRTLSLFQNIDALGNYSDPKWFLSLNKQEIIKFIRELFDIWSYRAQLSHETKRNICPPHGDPFRHLNMSYIYAEQNINNIRNMVLEILEKFVNSGINNDNKALGAYYVVGSLTLVNENAATSLPWLFQSFGHF